MIAAELRIGNVVKVKENGQWKTALVTSVFPTWIIAKNPWIHLGGPYDPKEIHGAYFNDDWLVENGWEVCLVDNKTLYKRSRANNHFKNVMIERLENDMFRLVRVSKVHGAKPISRTFEYIHELQNLFLDISGISMMSISEVKGVLALAAPIIDEHTESDD